MGMVAMKCPSCSADIELDDSREFGFCNFCGTKVMQDKIVVEHRGNVKVDNSEFVKKYLANARRARKKEDWAEVEKYYNLVEQNDPENIEAIFYSSYGKLRCTILEEYSARWENDFEVLKKSISVLDDYFDMSDEENDRKVITEAVSDIVKLYDPKQNNIIVGTKPVSGVPVPCHNELKSLAKRLCPQIIETLDNIIVKYNAKNMDTTYLNHLKNDVESKKPGGCYVATAVYGSYDCPEVWTLRRFRDYSLAMTWYGRLFIAIYYAISPTIVKWFGHTLWFNRMWKGKLDRMVERLKSEGYEDTPYDDKNW